MSTGREEHSLESVFALDRREMGRTHNTHGVSSQWYEISLFREP